MQRQGFGSRVWVIGTIRRTVLRKIPGILGMLWVLLLSWCSLPTAAIALSAERQLVTEVWHTIDRAYVDDTFNGENWWRVREEYLKRRFDSLEDAYDAIDEMLAKLGDPFTRLLRPAQYRNLQVSTSGELTGVGLQIAFEMLTDESAEGTTPPPQARISSSARNSSRTLLQNSPTKILRAIAPIAGSPAEAAGIQAGDAILNIDGVPTDKLTLDDAAFRMRGKIGTHVVLRVQHIRDGSIENLDLVRAAIEIDPITSDLKQTALTPNLKVGYIRLSQFSATATSSMATAIQELDAAGANGYILDLRNNSGGLLQAGIDIARLWLNDATIVYTVNREGISDSYNAGHAALTDAPLMVLVNRGTASASEILAGALQDNGRAVLIGDRTFGKGLIQSLFDLSHDAGLAVTVAKYETPAHHDINKQGIQPDYFVELPETLSQPIIAATENDPVYQKAIELLAQAASDA